MKHYKVFDCKTGSDTLGTIAENDLASMYAPANLNGETPYTQLEVHASGLHEFQLSGKGVYVVTRVS